MLRALRAVLLPKPPEAVTATYIALVAAARNPFFYTELKVPDTLDGRFEMVVLHLFLMQHRLLREPSPEAALFSQQLGEAFVADLDANLRELGVADTGVSKRMKAMGKAYHGRLQAYAAAQDEEALRAALARNLYGTVREGSVTTLTQMAQYMSHANNALAAATGPVILSGQFLWTTPRCA